VALFERAGDEKLGNGQGGPKGTLPSEVQRRRNLLQLPRFKFAWISNASSDFLKTLNLLALSIPFFSIAYYESCKLDLAGLVLSFNFLTLISFFSIK
jgi:hypothetical protein